MLKRRGILASAALCALALAACGGSEGDAETAARNGEPERVTIASLLQPPDNPWVQNNIRFQEHVAEALGIDLQVSTDQGTDESNVATMRALIAQQPDGILFDPISEAAGKQDAALLEQYDMIGATQDRLVVPHIDEYQGDNLVAQTTQSNETWGYNTMKTLIDAGAKNIVTIMPPHGILTVEQFWVGAKKALEENPDVMLVQESWVEQSRESAIQTMERYLTKYPAGQIDGVVAIGSTMGLGAVYATKQAGRDSEIQVATADDDPDVIEAINNGDLVASYGTHWTNGGWGLIVLYDHLQGHEPLERQPEFNLFKIDKSNADEYAKRFLDGQPLTAEEIRSLSLTYNPDADLPAFLEQFHETWNDESRGLR
jgi:ABC-type sugar transport system substrate-binding protein